MRIGSLFAGIGGLELGLEWSGLGHTIWQVENDPFRRTVLEKHWPHVDRSVADVKEAGARNLAAVDVICGGFPCRNVSSTGNRLGLTGPESRLWYEYLRIVGELRPRWVIVENVASGADLWVDLVSGDLARQGYASLPIPLEARDVGAPQLRARVFVIACSRYSDMADTAEGGTEAVASARLHHHRAQRYDASRCGHHAYPPARGDTKGWAASANAGHPQPGIRRGTDGFSSALDLTRLGALGDAVIPQMSEVIGHVIRKLEAGDV